MKRSRYCWLLLTACWLLAGAGLAQEPARPKIPPPPPLTSLSYLDTFKLWNECALIGLVVEELPDGAADIDLTKERIQALVESRLRVARLYDAAVPLYISYLYVRVGVIVSENRRSGAFSIEVSFKKDVLDVVSDRNGSAVTWATTIYGIHAGDADYILQAVSERLDWFILEYLRVNETACR